jgi:hypothetical protein
MTEPQSRAGVRRRGGSKKMPLAKQMLWPTVSLFALALVRILSYRVFVGGRATCEPVIRLDGVSYDYSAAVAAAKIKLSEKPNVSNKVSELVVLYFDHTRRLCLLHSAGGLDAVAYERELSKISDRFASLIAVQSKAPLIAMNDAQVRDYVALLEQLRPNERSAKSIGLRVSVLNNGRPIGSG